MFAVAKRALASSAGLVIGLSDLESKPSLLRCYVICSAQRIVEATVKLTYSPELLLATRCG